MLISDWYRVRRADCHSQCESVNSLISPVCTHSLCSLSFWRLLGHFAALCTGACALSLPSVLVKVHLNCNMSITFTFFFPYIAVLSAFARINTTLIAVLIYFHSHSHGSTEPFQCTIYFEYVFSHIYTKKVTVNFQP